MFYESQTQTITVTRKHDKNGNPVYTAKASYGPSVRHLGQGRALKLEYEAAAQKLITKLSWPGDWTYGEGPSAPGQSSRVFVSLDGVNGK